MELLAQETLVFIVVEDCRTSESNIDNFKFELELMPRHTAKTHLT